MNWGADINGDQMQPVVTPRPSRDLVPSSDQISEILELIEKAHLDRAEIQLSGFSPQNQTDRIWAEYLAGQLLFGRKSFDEGAAKLLAIYQQFKTSPESFSAEQRRILAKSLKRIGWNFRRQKDYHAAYAHHHVAYLIYEKLGSYSELHDAAISLDVDAYFLGDAELDEYWLSRSIEAARQIQESRRRSEALGTSYNNLAATLSGLKRFEQALAAARESFTQWQEYEALAGPSEFKLVWAHFSIADVYHSWAVYASKTSEHARCRQVKELALQEYLHAAELARLRTMSQRDLDFILSKTADLEALSCSSQSDSAVQCS